MSGMYQEIILEYYRHPKNQGAIENASIVEHDVNTSCGDEVTMYVDVKNNVAKTVHFTGKGCAISQAASSMLTELVQGKPLEEIASLKKEDVIELLNIPISPMRLKCALLGFKVLKLGVLKYAGEENHEN